MNIKLVSDVGEWESYFIVTDEGEYYNPQTDDYDLGERQRVATMDVQGLTSIIDEIVPEPYNKYGQDNYYVVKGQGRKEEGDDPIQAVALRIYEKQSGFYNWTDEELIKPILDAIKERCEESKEG